MNKNFIRNQQFQQQSITNHNSKKSLYSQSNDKNPELGEIINNLNSDSSNEA